MAKVVSEVIAAALAKKDQRRTYPWRSWTDGRIWHLKRGVDFDVEPSSFKITANSWANKHGCIPDVRLTEDGEGVLLKLIPG